MKKEKKITTKEARKLYLQNHKRLVNEEVQSFVSLQDINKIYPNHVQAVFNFNLEIQKHDFIVLVGPSGCGKSTTLRMIAGLEDISSGYLYIDHQLANYLPSKERKIAMVFQSYALYPHMTVYGNMSYGLKVRKEWLPKYDKKTKEPIVAIDEKQIQALEKEIASLDEHRDAKQIQELQKKIEELKNHPSPVLVLRKYTEEEIKERVFHAADFLDLGAYLDRKPKELSGGQMQRVALGRALVRKSRLFLMDEPLSNLDAKLRVSMRSEIVRIHKEVGATTIYVTHDQTEAMTMATKIVVMNKGWIQQVGTPREIYMNPENLFVATFIGSPAMNIMEGTYQEGRLTLKDGTVLPYDERMEKQHHAFYQKKIAHWKQLLERIHHPASAQLEKEVQNVISKIKNHELNTLEEMQKEIAKLDTASLLEDIALQVQDAFEEILTLSSSTCLKKRKVLEMLKKVIGIISNEQDARIDLELQKINSYKEFIQNKESSSLPKETPVYSTLEEKRKRIEEIIHIYEDNLVSPHILKIGIRPEDLTLVRKKNAETISVHTTIVELIGSDYFIHTDFPGCDLIAKVPNQYILHSGSSIILKLNMQKVHLFDELSGQKITQIEEVDYVDLL